ncbi:MAG: hypothetical protein WDN03_06110 [Rhizomicrobium sp.]
MLLSTATRGWKRAMEPSLSSISLTNISPRPTRALAKGAAAPAKFVITAPFITVGSSPAWCRIQPIMAVVVDLPLVPATPTAPGESLNSSARSSARSIVLAPTRRAAWTSGTVSSTAAEATRTVVLRREAAAVLREERDAGSAQIIELGRQPALVEGAVGAGHRGAARLQDQRERQHAAAADAAEEIGPV